MATLLAPEPLAEWLRTKIDQLGGSTAAATILDVDEAQLRRMAADNLGGRLQLGTVDNVLVAAGEPHLLAVLYPLDVGALMDRWCPTCDEVVTVGQFDPDCPWCGDRAAPRPRLKPSAAPPPPRRLIGARDEAGLRREVAAGDLSLAEALEDERAVAVPVERLVRACPGVRMRVAEALLDDHGIGWVRTVAQLTTGQRDELLADARMRKS